MLCKCRIIFIIKLCTPECYNTHLVVWFNATKKNVQTCFFAFSDLFTFTAGTILDLKIENVWKIQGFLFYICIHLRQYLNVRMSQRILKVFLVKKMHGNGKCLTS